MRPVVPSRPETELDQLADYYGVLPEYVGADGEHHRADPDALAAVLVALGAPLAAPSDAADALRAARAARSTRVVEPVLVHWISQPRPFRILLPRGTHPRDGRLSIVLEDGSVRSERLSTAISRPVEGLTADGRRYEGYEISLGVSPTRRLAPGYHRLVIEAPGVEADSLLVAAPYCPLPTRGWVGFLPLHALRTDHDWGVGSYPDLGRLARWITGLGGSSAGTLPLYPMHTTDRLDPSPYRPETRLGWSELFIDVTAVPELEIAPEARRLLSSPALQERIAANRRSVLVHHADVLETVHAVIDELSGALDATDSRRRAEFEVFAAARPDLVAYSRFCGDENATDSGSGARRARSVLYGQWIADQQLEGAARMGGLYLDVPVGVHPAGFDPIWEPESFVTDVHVGAPPDDFFSAGQNWGFPALHPVGIRDHEYRHPIAVLRHAMRHASLARLDHVMGLHRLYWIPKGFDASHGVYVRYRAEELRAIVATEANRTATSVIGEDLGTVPSVVRRDMDHDRMLRSFVLQFESTPEQPFPNPPELALASWATHDLPRFAAYWNGVDVDERLGRGEIDRVEAATVRGRRSAWRQAVAGAPVPASAAPGAASDSDTAAGRDQVLGALARSRARLVLVDLEDLWLERRPQNRPGMGSEPANWRRRAARTLSDMMDDPEMTALLDQITSARLRGATPGDEVR